MATWRDYLQRFRPAGVAGAAAPAGVPADRVEEASAELAPVFDLLADTERQLTALREQGLAGARHRLDRANARAAGIVASARDRAEAVRAEAAANAAANGARPPDDRPARIRARSARTMTTLVDRAVAIAVRRIEAGAR